MFPVYAIQTAQAPRFTFGHPQTHAELVALNTYSECVKELRHATSNTQRMGALSCYQEILQDTYNKKVHPSKLGKSHTTANQLRISGNEIFNTGPADQLHQAHALYTRAIAIAPSSDYSEELAYAYGNRSAVLRTMWRLEECIQDVERALEAGYPVALRFKLLLRMARCYRDLHKPSASHFATAIKYVRKLTNITATERRSMLQTLFEEQELEPMKFQKYQACYRPFPITPKLAYGRNVEAPCASSAVKIKFDEKFGRHLVATRDIKTGDALIVEQPLAMLPNADMRYSHCTHCLTRCLALIPCPHCRFVMFCSRACLEESLAEYHTFECALLSRFLALDEPSKQFQPLLLIRTISRLGLAALRRYHEECEARPPVTGKTKGFDSEGRFRSGVAAIYHMESHEEKYIPESLFHHCKLVKEVVYCLEKLGFDVSDPMPGLLLKLNMAIYNQQCGVSDEDGTDDMGHVDMGACLPVTQSLANHSCDPNIFGHFSSGRYFVTRALHPIRKGEQLMMRYTHSFLTAPKQYRQDKLRDYFFTCTCRACEEDWPDFNHMPRHTLNKQELRLVAEHEQLCLLQVGWQSQVQEHGVPPDHPKLLKARQICLRKSYELVDLLHSRGKTMCFQYYSAIKCLEEMHRYTNVDV